MSLIAFVFLKLLTPKDLVSQMSKSPLLRTTFNCQHVKGSQILLKLARQHFYPIALSL